MNITYKEYKEKLKIELNEYKEKLKLKLDEFKAKQNKKLENFKLKISKKNKRSSKRKIKGGDLTDDEIDEVINFIIDIYNTLNTFKFDMNSNDIEKLEINEKSKLLNVIITKIKEVINDKFKDFSSNIKTRISEPELISIFTNQRITETEIYNILNKAKLLHDINNLIISYFKEQQQQQEFGGGKRKSKFFHK